MVVPFASEPITSPLKKYALAQEGFNQYPCTTSSTENPLACAALIVPSRCA
jgi:hypothetical protein